jgi:hypothetical protein
MTCLHIVVHLCLVMGMHLWLYTLIYRMHEWSGYDLDIEM